MSLNIYAAHSSNIDFEKYYQVLKDSELHTEHNIIYPHDETEEQFDSYTFFHTDCDLIIAEVSAPSTGIGIELGWAYDADIPIIAIHSIDSKPTQAIFEVTKMVYEYDSDEELISTLKNSWKAL